MQTIKFSDWENLDLRVGEILEVKDIEVGSKVR